MDGSLGVLIFLVLVVGPLAAWALWLHHRRFALRKQREDFDAERHASEQRLKVENLHELAVIAAKKEVENATLIDLQTQVRALQEKVVAASWTTKK